MATIWKFLLPFKRNESRKSKKPKHKSDCRYANQKITIIHNWAGQRICECHYNFCFYCGAKLK